MTFDNMYLYVQPGCPYCAKVDTFLAKHEIEMEHRSVFEGNNAEELEALGGKVQSPCLVVDGKPLYESDDIIAFLCEQMGIPVEHVPLGFGSACPLKSGE